MPNVKLPNGQTAKFPDSMSVQDIQRTIETPEFAQQMNRFTSRQSLHNNAVQESRTTSASGGIKGGEDIEPAITAGDIAKGAGRGGLNLVRSLPGVRGVERGINQSRSGNFTAPTLSENLQDSPLGDVMGLGRAEVGAGRELGSQIKAGEGGRAVVTALSMLDPFAVGSVGNVNQLQNEGKRGEAIGQGGVDAGALAAPIVAKGVNALRGPIGRAMVNNAPTLGKIGGTATGIAGVPKTGGLSLLTIPRASRMITGALRSTGEAIQPRGPTPVFPESPLGPVQGYNKPIGPVEFGDRAQAGGNAADLEPEHFNPREAEVPLRQPIRTTSLEEGEVSSSPQAENTRELPEETVPQTVIRRGQGGRIGATTEHIPASSSEPITKYERNIIPENQRMADIIRADADRAVGVGANEYQVGAIRKLAEHVGNREVPITSADQLQGVEGIGKGGIQRVGNIISDQQMMPGLDPDKAYFAGRAMRSMRTKEPITGAVQPQGQAEWPGARLIPSTRRVIPGHFYDENVVDLVDNQGRPGRVKFDLNKETGDAEHTSIGPINEMDLMPHRLMEGPSDFSDANRLDLGTSGVKNIIGQRNEIMGGQGDVSGVRSTGANPGKIARFKKKTQ